MIGVKRYGSGGPWEDVVGYSRVVVAGDRAITAGCTSTVDGEVAFVGDAYNQTRQAYLIALDALVAAGANIVDVIRTRTYLVRPEDADDAGKAHRELFGDVRPVSTMLVVARLMHPDHLVEVEVEAYLAR
jgi:enamine deaminase RidA (YjgF/YER057c/UK114 family)